MKKLRWVLLVLLLMVFCQIGGSFAATEEASAPSPIDPDAMAILMKMADFISKAKSFSVTIESGYDSVQDNGEKIEYGGTRKLIIDRPNRARENVEQRDGTQADFIFNGKEIFFYNAKDNVFGRIERPGTIDDAMEYFTEELDMRLPLSELFLVDLPTILREQVLILDYVDKQKIEGADCDHLAARTENVDFQVWIEQGAKPLLRRVIITYKNALGQPQYRAEFSDWNFSPKITDSLFTISPPKGAEEIPFAALMENKSDSEQ